MKRVSLLALILALSLSLTGCFNKEMKLYDALNKMQDVTSMQSETMLEFSLETKGLSEEAELAVAQIAPILNNLNIETKQLMTQKPDKASAKTEVETKFNIADIPMSVKVWMDVDLNEPKMVQIIRMPELLRGFLFQGQPAKEYLVYDMAEMAKVTEEQVDFQKVLEFSQEFQPKITEFIKGMQKDFNPGFDIVKSLGNQEIGDQQLDVYELRLDDASLKELIKYGVNYSMDSKLFMEFMKGYMDAVMEVVATEVEEQQVAREEIAAMMADLEKNMPEYKEKFNEFMETYKDIEILGENGLVIEYGINKKGLIAHEKLSMDLVLNLDKIGKAIGEDIPDMKGIIKLGISSTTRNYNINSKVLAVAIPKVDEKNSIGIMELMESQMGQFNIE